MTQDPRISKAAGLFQKGLRQLFSERDPGPAAKTGTGEPASDAPPQPPPSVAAAAAPATLAAVARYRIVFQDNAGRPLYPLDGRGTAPLSASEEQIARARALSALHEARAAGRILGKPAKGAYAGREAEAVMGEAEDADLQAFLAFVLANPRGFMEGPLRISEAFLAWLVDRGAP